MAKDENKDIRILFYSGDTDGAVPTYGTKQWIEKLGWKNTTDWMPWITNTQVSGYSQNYGQLQFTTVKGTGHMAPQWKKPEVFNLIKSFVNNKPITGE